VTALRFTVAGRAEPRGSKTKTRFGIRDANPKSRPWMDQVAGEAMRAMERAGLPLFDGAVYVRLVFFRPRPKGHYRAAGALSAAGVRNPYPTTAPDAGKLARAVEDAMIGIVYRDDAQIVSELLWKQWGEPARVEIDVAEMIETPRPGGAVLVPAVQGWSGNLFDSGERGEADA
jgi:Holliday junction resolvase RusA-like endonuclease